MLNEKELARFESKFVPEPMSGCWIWISAINGTNYGSFFHQGKSKLAHRIAKMHYHGIKLKPYEFCCHTCDNTFCVNPDHLYVGDYKTNTADCENRKRRIHPKGTANGKSVLSQWKADYIKNVAIPAQEKGIITLQQIADAAGVSLGCIGSIKYGRTWK